MCFTEKSFSNLVFPFINMCLIIYLRNIANTSQFAIKIIIQSPDPKKKLTNRAKKSENKTKYIRIHSKISEAFWIQFLDYSVLLWLQYGRLLSDVFQFCLLKISNLNIRQT